MLGNSQQDFHAAGTAPLVEIFSNRMEITNPGLPLVKTDRFLDSPPKSRNETLASFMRRIGVCEERGSGVDKVVFQTELYQLPAPIFETTPEHTRAVLFAHREFREMDKEDRIRASCLLSACLAVICTAGFHDQHYFAGSVWDRSQKQRHGFANHQGYNR